MTDYDRTNTGVLFNAIEKKTSDRSPDYTGSINIDGREMWLSAWIKTGQKGKFMSLAVKPKEAAAPAPRTAQRPPPPRQSGGGGGRGFDDMDDSIPF